VKKIKMSGTNILIEEERLSTLLKVFREGENTHFAQAYIQTGIMGEAIIKGLNSPMMCYRKRKELTDAVYAYIATMGYDTSVMQRAKYNNGIRRINTVKKKLRGVQ
jgi:hypothetical protein